MGDGSGSSMAKSRLPAFVSWKRRVGTGFRCLALDVVLSLVGPLLFGADNFLRSNGVDTVRPVGCGLGVSPGSLEDDGIGVSGLSEDALIEDLAIVPDPFPCLMPPGLPLVNPSLGMVVAARPRAPCEYSCVERVGGST